MVPNITESAANEFVLVSMPIDAMKELFAMGPGTVSIPVHGAKDP